MTVPSTYYRRQFSHDRKRPNSKKFPSVTGVGDYIVPTSLLETFLMMFRSTSTLPLLVWKEFITSCPFETLNVRLVYVQQNKKKAKTEGKRCHSKTMKSKKKLLNRVFLESIGVGKVDLQFSLRRVIDNLTRIVEIRARRLFVWYINKRVCTLGFCVCVDALTLLFTWHSFPVSRWSVERWWGGVFWMKKGLDVSFRVASVYSKVLESQNFPWD